MSHGPSSRLMTQRGQARGGRPERDVLNDVQHRHLRVKLDTGGCRASGELRLEAIDDNLGANAARALHEHEVSRLARASTARSAACALSST